MYEGLQIVKDTGNRKWTAAYIKCPLCSEEWIAMWDIDERDNIGEGGKLPCPGCKVDTVPKILAPVGKLALQNQVIACDEFRASKLN